MAHSFRHVNGVSIQALPTEILLYIFSECAGAAEASWEDNPEKSIYPWTRVLRVCRLWRDIALSYPLLWTGILMRESLRISYNTLAKLFLVRSRGKPIRLYVLACKSLQVKHEIDWRVRELLQQAIPRAREIHIHLMRNTDLDSFWQKFAAPAQLMSSLRIVCKTDPPPGNQRQAFHTLRQHTVDVLPRSGLFLDTTPHLRSITIHGTSFAPARSRTPKLLLQALQSVELSEESLYSIKKLPTPLHHLRVTAQTLTALIIRSRNLRPLEVDDPDNSLPIEFPCLRRLEVSSALSFAVDVLARVDMPQTTGVRIDLCEHIPTWVSKDEDRSPAVRDLTAAFLKLLAGGQPICAVSVTPTRGDRDSRVFYSFWTESPPSTLPRFPEWSTASPVPRLTFANAAEAPAPPSLSPSRYMDNSRLDTAELLGVLPLTTCRVLYLHQVPTDTAAWEGDALLRSATSLHTIEAWGEMAARALINLLDPPSEETMIARLSTLRIVRFVGLTVDFRDRELAQDIESIAFRRASRALPALEVKFRP